MIFIFAFLIIIGVSVLIANVGVKYINKDDDQFVKYLELNQKRMKEQKDTLDKMFAVGIPVYYNNQRMIPVRIDCDHVRFLIDHIGIKAYSFEEISYDDLIGMYAFITTPMLLEDKS